MGDATALRLRVELRLSDEREPIVAGFHDDGRFSVYFGSDPVYHFDPQGRLRRAFVAGELYRSRGNTLARLSRERRPGATELARHDLTPRELQSFLTQMTGLLESWRQSLESGRTEVLRTVPDGADLHEQLLAVLPRVCQAQLSPLVGRRR